MTHLCPWEKCGKTLDDNTHHPEHERFAEGKDTPAAVIRHEDGHIDLLRTKPDLNIPYTRHPSWLVLSPDLRRQHDCEKANCEADLDAVYRHGPHKGKRVPRRRPDGTFDNPDNVPLKPRLGPDGKPMLVSGKPVYDL